MRCSMALFLISPRELESSIFQFMPIHVGSHLSYLSTSDSFDNPYESNKPREKAIRCYSCHIFIAQLQRLMEGSPKFSSGKDLYRVRATFHDVSLYDSSIRAFPSANYNILGSRLQKAFRIKVSS